MRFQQRSCRQSLLRTMTAVILPECGDGSDQRTGKSTNISLTWYNTFGMKFCRVYQQYSHQSWMMYCCCWCRRTNDNHQCRPRCSRRGSTNGGRPYNNFGSIITLLYLEWWHSLSNKPCLMTRARTTIKHHHQRIACDKVTMDETGKPDQLLQ